MSLATQSNATERAPRTAALVGANREMLALCQAQSVSIEAVIDPALEGEMWQEIPIYCDDTRYLRQNRPDAAVLGIDIPATRARAAAAYEAAGVPLGDVMATQPGAGTIWGDGLIMQFDAFLSVDTVLGRGVRMNVGATVMHDNIIGDFVTVAPRALLLGHVQVGARSYIGAHATVLPGVRVGEDAVVGAGAVVTRDVADGAVVKGIPAK